MEINATGFAAKELAPNRASIEQELAQKTQETDENTQLLRQPLEPRPVDQVDGDKLGRIDIYA